MSELTITGTVKGRLAVREFDTAKGPGRAQTLIVELDQYSGPLPIDFYNDHVELIKDLEKDQEVQIAINLKGKKHNDRFFPTISGWKVGVPGEEMVTATSGQKSDDIEMA